MNCCWRINLKDCLRGLSPLTEATVGGIAFLPSCQVEHGFALTGPGAGVCGESCLFARQVVVAVLKLKVVVVASK